MRPSSLKLLAALVTAVVAMSAAPALAGINAWSGLGDLDAGSGAGWVREYATGTLPTTIYAATEGGGVYRTDDNGLGWTPMISGLDKPGAKDVRTVFTSGATVYAGTGAGLFKSVGGGGWTPVAQGPEEDPKNPKKLNAAVQAVLTGTGGTMLAGVASGGVYKSADGGATWKPPAPGNGMVRSETVWSLAEFIPGVVFAATQSGMYRSTDFGSTWTLASDGITGTVLRAFKDEKAPNIYYAAGTDGIFRTINAGLTWSKINSASGLNVPSGAIRAMKQLTGIQLTRLYVGTPNGVFAGTTDHGPLPGEVKWRKVTDSGLGNNTIVWALSNFLTTPGTLLAGTQSNGGYSLTFTPAVNTSIPTIAGTPPTVGKVLTADEGTWTGTETIEYEYQWQRCTGTLPQTCSDVQDATEKTFVVPPNSVGARWRVQVTGKNDFPTFGLNEANSAITGTTAIAPGPLPGTVQQLKAGVDIDDPGSDGQPQPGDVARAKAWSFNPPATVDTDFQWSVCEGAVCEEIPGATNLTYTIREADVDGKLCVAVTGRNAHGATMLECGAQTNTVVSEDPKQLAPATLMGSAYAGDTLVSTVGAWKTASTTFARRWMRCEAGGGSCEYIPGASGATFALTNADLGKRLKVEIKADTNGPNNLPLAVYVYTPLSDVVTPPPAPEPDPTPTPQPGDPQPTATPQATATPQPAPAPDSAAPVLGVKAASSKLKSNTALKLHATLSEAASLSVTYERKRTGRKVGKNCKVSAKKGQKCTVYTKIATVKVAGVGGSSTVTLPKRKLAAGDYRVVVVPTDGAGNKGAAKTVSFKVRK